MGFLDENTNKILLGNAYELIKKIPDKSIDCIYTDIPYLYLQNGVGYSDLSKRTMVKKESLKDISDGIDFSILYDFVRVMKKINCFIWCSKLQILDVMNYFAKTDINYEILVWCKTNPMPTTSNTWLPDIEYCLYFREKGVKLNDGYDIKHKYYVQGINKMDKDLYGHPTIKPLKIVKNHLLHTTQKNDIILDPFSGSGTSCVAGKEIGRRFLGFELDKNYYKVSIDRLNGIDKNGQMSIFTNFENM